MKGMKKKLICVAKLLAVVPFILLLSPYILLEPQPLEKSLASLLWSSVFGTVTAGEVQSIVLSFENLGVLFLFTLLFGTCIARFYDENSHMVFTRITKRDIWSLKQILKVWGYAAAYTLVFLAFKFLLEMRRVTVWQWDGILVEALVVIFGILCPVLAILCLIANWIAIRRGAPVGVLLTFVGALVVEEIAIAWFDVPAMTVFNPLCSNIHILDMPVLAALKVGVNIGYLSLISVGMLLDIKRMDIF